MLSKDASDSNTSGAKSAEAVISEQRQGQTGAGGMTRWTGTSARAMRRVTLSRAPGCCASFVYSGCSDATYASVNAACAVVPRIGAQPRPCARRCLQLCAADPTRHHVSHQLCHPLFDTKCLNSARARQDDAPVPLGPAACCSPARAAWPCRSPPHTRTWQSGSYMLIRPRRFAAVTQWVTCVTMAA